MRRFYAIAFAAIIFLALLTPAQAKPIHGELTTINGIEVLRLWGGDYDMGYAQGFLLGDRIREMFLGYIPQVVYAFIYNWMVDVFPTMWEIPEPYMEEAQGLFDGAVAAGLDPFIPYLQRDLTPMDIAAVGAISDIESMLACSSVIGWGESTSGDGELNGGAVIARNMDWYAGPDDPTWLARQTMIFARTPDEGRPTVSVAFPGFLGCLSCMNDAGVVAVHHQSYPNVPFDQIDFSRKFIPIDLTLRTALEARDVDGDGESTIEDVAETIESDPRSSSYNLLLLDANPSEREPMVIEANNKESARRYAADDPGMPQKILAATNSYRTLTPRDSCWRYDKIAEDANAWQGKLNLDRIWQALFDAMVTFEENEDATAQSMIFIPASRRMALTYADQQLYAPEKPPVWFSWDQLFGVSSGDDTADDDSAADDVDSDDTQSSDVSDDDDKNDSCGGC